MCRSCTYKENNIINSFISINKLFEIIYSVIFNKRREPAYGGSLCILSMGFLETFVAAHQLKKKTSLWFLFNERRK